MVRLRFSPVWLGKAWFIEQKLIEMNDSKRQPHQLWQETRKRIWLRDQGRCQGPYCQHQLQPLLLQKAHIDHVVELSHGGTNADANLRILCRHCHCLRASIAHRGMIAAALRDEIIPSNWRELVWEG